MKHLVAFAALLTLPAPIAARATTPLIDIYHNLHRYPELSRHEQRTSAVLAAELKQAGFSVTERVGIYADGIRAYGVVGVLKNGVGPTLLLRADMDALPIVEETGASYASKVRMTTNAGETTGVMHACGHDIHSTVMIGAARALAKQRDSWRGTLVFVGQPSEETLEGSAAMLRDGLYQRFGRPDMIVGLHDTNALPAGKASLALGPAQAGVTSIDVAVRGIGGHGALPQFAKDPIVMAAELITQLQTIVSREQDPLDPAVLTVGTIRGGTKRNIIPDTVKLELTARAMSDRAMKVILDGVRARVAGVSVSFGLLPSQTPTVAILDNESAPPVYNNLTLGVGVKAGLEAALGKDNVSVSQPVMASDDFSRYGLDHQQIPSAFFLLGAVEPAAFRAASENGKPLPGPHNSKFLPDAELTLATGVKAMTRVIQTLLNPAN